MKPRGFRSWILPVVAPLALAACAVGPDYHAPSPPPVTGYTPAPLAGTTAAPGGIAQQFVSGADISGAWWTLYHSPQLNALIAAGLANNPTLAAAQQTLIEAEETLRAAQGQFLPSISGSFTDERERISAAEGASFAGAGAVSGQSLSPFTLYDASLSLSYTPDVFGGVRRQVESLAAQAQYQRFELEAAYLTLTANIVTAAVAEASLQAQIDATRQVLGAEQSQLGILQRQVALGGVAVADVLSEQATMENTAATLPPLSAQLAAQRDQLAAYVGVLPGNFQSAGFTLASLQLPPSVPVSLPSALLAQRPDIAAAAAQLHEATANVGVATANMLPQITLSAGVGHEALDTAALFTPQTLAWNLIAGLTQPLFEGGTLSARRRASIAALRVAAAQYQATVIAAFQNVADTLQVLQFDADTLAAASAAAAAAGKSLAVTQSQYRLGGGALTAVLVAQTTYQNAVVSQAKATASRLADTAALFQALGGGWWHRADVDPAAQDCCGLIP